MAHTTLNNKKNNPIKKKKKKGAEDLNRHFFQRRHKDDQEANEKILNIANYYRNAYQNQNKIPSLISQNGHH